MLPSWRMRSGCSRIGSSRPDNRSDVRGSATVENRRSKHERRPRGRPNSRNRRQRRRGDPSGCADQADNRRAAGPGRGALRPRRRRRGGREAQRSSPVDAIRTSVRASSTEAAARRRLIRGETSQSFMAVSFRPERLAPSRSPPAGASQSAANSCQSSRRERPGRLACARPPFADAFVGGIPSTNASMGCILVRSANSGCSFTVSGARLRNGRGVICFHPGHLANLSSALANAGERQLSLERSANG